MLCPKCGNENPDLSRFCTACGAALENNAPAVAEVVPEAPALPMKWYNFVVKFALFASMAINAFSAVKLAASILTSFAYLNFFFLFDAVVIILAIICIPLAWKARKELVAFKKTGPASLYTLYYVAIASNAINGVGVILASLYFGIIPNFASAIFNVIVPVVYLACNKIYFDKRSAMFIN